MKGSARLQLAQLRERFITIRICVFCLKKGLRKLVKDEGADDNPRKREGRKEELLFATGDYVVRSTVLFSPLTDVLTTRVELSGSATPFFDTETSALST